MIGLTYTFYAWYCQLKTLEI